MFLDGFFFWSFQKGKNISVFFLKPFAFWIFFWTKLMEKGDGNPWILVNDSFRVISRSHSDLHSIAVILVLSYWTCLRYRLQGGWGVISRTIRSRQLLRLFQGVGGWKKPSQPAPFWVDDFGNFRFGRWDMWCDVGFLEGSISFHFFLGKKHHREATAKAP